MDNKKIIIIGIILIIIVVGVLFVILTTVNYEPIKITPNGTSIDVPANETKFDGEVESARIWHWNNGILITYNSYEDDNILKVTDVGFNAVKNLVKNGEKQNIDNFTCYVINADELLSIKIFDVIKVNYDGKFYCIPLSNETTHDNIIICSKDQNVAVHMAQSVQYKNVFPKPAGLNKTASTIGNITGDLQSKANDYLNNFDLSKVKSTFEEKSGIDLDNVKSEIDKRTG